MSGYSDVNSRLPCVMSRYVWLAGTRPRPALMTPGAIPGHCVGDLADLRPGRQHRQRDPRRGRLDRALLGLRGSGFGEDPTDGER